MYRAQEDDETLKYNYLEQNKPLKIQDRGTMVAIDNQREVSGMMKNVYGKERMTTKVSLFENFIIFVCMEVKPRMTRSKHIHTHFCLKMLIK